MLQVFQVSVKNRTKLLQALRAGSVHVYDPSEDSPENSSLRMSFSPIQIKTLAPRTIDDFWRKYRLAAQRLKIHDKPLHKTVVIRAKYGIAETNKQSFSKLQYIEKKTEISLHMTVPGIDLKEVGIPTVQLKSEALATIAERYPSEEWIHVYTVLKNRKEWEGFHFLSCARLNSC
ncbi:hypothetical protein CEXT_737921 [Caerostris extrusa]|uniref:Ribosomal protein L9 n=1 Tax=Caerostris extrusa TaxID=172846 RepID=A0AAV4XXM3_CAEEX|nr:hypothetical protein CEXT_737921 [Caerostris extrusa]